MPIGIDNNNPTNLRPLPAGELWNGQTGSMGGFCVFQDPEHGIRAAAITLRSYGRAGTNTVRTIYRTWAPASDGNDPDAYGAFVSAQTGFGLDQVLDLTDQPTLVALIAASTLMENGVPPEGKNWYTPDVFAAGVALAFT